MAPREQNRFVDLTELAAKLPWWVGVVLAAIAYVILHSMVIREIADVVEPGNSGGLVGAQLGKTFAMVGQYLLPAAFLSGAALSAYGRYTRRALHQQVAASPDRGALSQLSWQQFEALVGEAFRRKGYADLGRNTTVMASLIDGFNAMLASLAAEMQSSGVDLRPVDLRPLFRNDAQYPLDWANELHPTRPAFKRVAAAFAAQL